VVALCPGYTRTELHERAGVDMRRTPDWLWLDAEEVVDEAFAALARGTVVCVPSPQYKTIVAVARHLPARAWSGIGRQVRRRRRRPEAPGVTSGERAG
jgi:short-subunit dehydrogenase